ncbi:MAG: DNA alkylation repair protein [Lachnospiraceae bacterium]|nr:DNA alkylation repair protein [Lachnospiraceae bacterium]
MPDINQEIKEELFKLKDEKYKAFQSKLIPSVSDNKVIGVRTPALRSYAGGLLKREDISYFLEDLPHEYFDEYQLHAFIISGIKDYEKCMEEVEKFLAYIDNWATCDQMNPRIFKKNRSALIEKIKIWIKSEETYKVRFGIKMLMDHFLDEDFDPKYLKTVADIRTGEYYINMMRAWYFATALAKQYDKAVSYIENRSMDEWTHKKTIQKSVESYRISLEQKEYLKSLK